MSERRRFRRAELSESIPVSLRPRAGEVPPAEITGQVKNISLAGLSCSVPNSCGLQPGDEVSCQVLIPPSNRRNFPFQRILGRGTILRATPDASAAPASTTLAVAFMPDVTAFGTIEY